MRFVMDGCRRKSLRRTDHDYTRANIYFITIDIRDRMRLFGLLDPDGLHINDAGLMVMQEWAAVGRRFRQAKPGVLVVMPDHIHGIMAIDPGHADGQRQALRPTLNDEGDVVGLPRVMQAFKSLSTRRYSAGVRQNGWPEYNGKLWQRNYYEHIVRSQLELDSIVKYIQNNPARLWKSVYEFDDGVRDLE
jgi:putative transposase